MYTVLKGRRLFSSAIRLKALPSPSVSTHYLHQLIIKEGKRENSFNV